jgi:hypothetical protein
MATGLPTGERPRFKQTTSMMQREDLKRLSKVAELRLKKLDEIRRLLSISPDADERDVLRMMKWWRKTGAGEASVPVELKTRVDRLLCEFHSLNDANLEILETLEALGKRAR